MSTFYERTFDTKLYLRVFQDKVATDLICDGGCISSRVVSCCSLLDAVNTPVLPTALSPNLVVLFAEDKQQLLLLFYFLMGYQWLQITPSVC